MKSVDEGKDPGIKLTSLKLDPNVGGGLRILAALDGIGIGEAGESAVHQVLRSHGIEPTPLPPKIKRGRPVASVAEAAAAVLELRSSRKDAIPTRLSAETARQLSNLARSLGEQMGALAQQGAKLLIEGAEASLPHDVMRQPAGALDEDTVKQLQSLTRGEMAYPMVLRPRPVHNLVKDSRSNSELAPTERE